jgi:hypothetical protein
MKIHIITKSFLTRTESLDRLMFDVNDYVDSIKHYAEIIDIDIKVLDKLVYAVIKYNYK